MSEKIYEENQMITVKTTVNSSIEKVWNCWTDPEHIKQWNNASEDWCTPHAENDLRVGGRFLSRMEAKDGSFGFDFSGIYDEVLINERIAYTLDDGRKVKIVFIKDGGKIEVIEAFEAESTNSIELQQAGWQAILDNFKKHVEAVKLV